MYNNIFRINLKQYLCKQINSSNCTTLKAIELIEYKKKLDEAIEGNKVALFFNDSILHAMMIMEALFKKASTEGDQKVVYMYCGELSLFRDKTKNKVFNEKNNCSLDDLDKEQQSYWNQIDFYANLQSSFKEFIEKDGSLLEIIIANDVETLPQNSIWKIIKSNIDNHKIKIYKLKNDVGLDHFVTTKDSYRVENSDENKTAICGFRDESSANILIDNFKDLLNLSQKIF